jgi:hypothetical protein
VFDVTAKTIELFIDESSIGTIDLNTFAGGAYVPFLTNDNVGISWSDLGDGRFWMGNFQVGAVPEPSTLTLLGVECVGLIAFLRKRKAEK